ncbi:hypothetical protein PHYBLDRAFT_165415 [Phycomyces blakesleeanus NRRL 1555(-)]|uniref:Uncharacterized protein n=1 Tax=Phycomyces blakesleeanus (strain ATCC 8743b / DSM 1359 / FGSC 10004 / NBRC 33097 / NRRL 1555) TaxID=763407 RepID=A0A167NZ44_PHYB8|nr:hypothetical protein PHYBLDRAFT_165415 [Phycomyces blakesleeanus NRRL 1555(-)]OAD76921.1 hypothetical protein PHYBLDRAFT_165415 [Phycomyces blakesleeanus NRRL 1555(-)]|eukprot:XP_018294961.1 hypothetical protein PHYBLDRAFT_165415 [Phycomyces blakesleeanus NRRL 1555(-)]
MGATRDSAADEKMWRCVGRKFNRLSIAAWSTSSVVLKICLGRVIPSVKKLIDVLEPIVRHLLSPWGSRRISVVEITQYDPMAWRERKYGWKLSAERGQDREFVLSIGRNIDNCNYKRIKSISHMRDSARNNVATRTSKRVSTKDIRGEGDETAVDGPEASFDLKLRVKSVLQCRGCMRFLKCKQI